ncbi:hypothetical protein GCM10027346_10370 [Hymenobacter seoulensis]
MSAPSTPDSFLQKSDEELLYLVQHPALYHPALLAEASRELRRRGTSLPALTPDPIAVTTSIYDAPERSVAARWWPAGVLGVAVIGLSWWGLQAASTPEATAPKPVSTAPIVLEAVQTKSLPSFEAETAAQVAATRRQLSAADRADTTATGRYARMARRYWLAENAAAYLTAQAKSDSVGDVFPGQVDIALEKISWFMQAKAYNQSLTPNMEENLTLMQQGLVLRKTMLNNFKYRFENKTIMMDRDMNQANFEATDIGNELRGMPRQRVPIQGRLSDI